MVVRRRFVEGLLAVGSASALVVPVAAPVQAAEVDLAARMVHTASFPQVRGGAEYEAEHGQREFDIHIRGVRVLHGKLLTVRVHGAFVGRMRVGTGGRAHLERHRGVPAMAAGNVVRVRTASGKLVTYGTLHRDHD